MCHIIVDLLRTIKRPPWRTIVPGVGLLFILYITYLLWSPGLDVRDGRDDRGQNGIWLAHGWLGADSWFVSNSKRDEIIKYRDPVKIRNLAWLLDSHHIKYVFPHLCPADEYGNLPATDPQQVEAFLDRFAGFRVLPWVGGPNGVQVRVNDKKWRAGFVASIVELLKEHPRFAGVHINIEPMPSGDQGFLSLLDELKTALPLGKIISVAAYPPPTRFQPDADIHWDKDYFSQVSGHCDQMVVMMYDTALRKPKFYQYLMSQWTTEAVSWTKSGHVLLGVPAYEDQGVGYHDPKVENLENALMGIHRGLSHETMPLNYEGVAIYSEWEMDSNKWEYLEQHFLSQVRM